MPASAGADQHDPWVRLGTLLEDRRKQIDPRYEVFETFIRERKINYRLAWDLENHRRSNYRAISLRGAEVAYGVEPGSIDQALAGGDLTPSAAASQDQVYRQLLDTARQDETLGLTPGDYFAIWENRDDDVVRSLWLTDRLPASEKIRLIKRYLGQRVDVAVFPDARRRA